MKLTINNGVIIWINCMLFLMTCPVLGQVKKTKQLTPKDYHLWSALHIKDISNQGKWASYSLTYESGLDTLFIKSTTTKRFFAFPKGYNGVFINNNWFACMLPQNQFVLQNLTTGKIQYSGQVQSFLVVNKDQNIIIFRDADNGKSNMLVKNLKGDIIENIANVTSFALSPNKNMIAYCTSNESTATVSLLRFGKNRIKTTITISKDNQFENIRWQRNSKSLAFIARLRTSKPFTAHAILQYKIDHNQLFQYNTLSQNSWTKQMELNANYASSLGISDDGERVFFTIKKIPDSIKTKNSAKVEIWNAADRDLLPYNEASGNPDTYTRVAAWWPKSGKFFAVGDSLQPIAKLNGSQQFAIAYHPSQNKPSFKHKADRDYFLVDIETGSKIPFLQKHSGNLGRLSLSPGGMYIAYFKECNWWVYSIATQKHTNLTINSEGSFCGDLYNHPSEPSPFGVMGWTPNDESLLIYDQFDIWQFKLNETEVKRLTHGREQQKIYRLANSMNSDGIVSKERVINFEESILLKIETINNEKTGYSLLNKNQQVHTIVYQPKLISGLRKVGSNTFIYVGEDFNQPPSLVLKKGNKQAKVIFKSNPHHVHYNWGFSKLIEYKNAKGVNLNGVLFYPNNYDPMQQYPMIVLVYEKQTSALHKYVNPSLSDGSVLNTTHYTGQGYFVLFPDIVYEMGNLGFSAANCVISATKSALQIAPINKNRLGLIGHSFGGYQTNFIITQTNMFAAAISGSGLSDLTSSYLSMNWNNFKSNGWRYEYQQFRMKKTWIEDVQGYQKNSPIYGVLNISTPLLSYTGIEDKQISPVQTMEFYMALRRLGKEHIMLRYPKERHVISIPENKIDLSNRISQWFDHYLKEGEKPLWFQSQ